MVLVTGAWVASTVYLFRHPSDMNFATWATLCGTMTGFYHYMTQRDDKTPDCEHQ
jgi:hypothetical protein